MPDKHPMTLKGKLELEKQLEDLIKNQRPQVIKDIEEARGHGDLSENADYDAAKEKQAFIESKVSEIQRKLSVAEVIDVSQVKSDKVQFGAKVQLLDLDSDQKIEYQIVGEDEANVKLSKISVFSPLARALIGKKKSDIIELLSPKGAREYEVLGVKYEAD